MGWETYYVVGELFCGLWQFSERTTWDLHWLKTPATQALIAKAVAVLTGQSHTKCATRDRVKQLEPVAIRDSSPTGALGSSVAIANDRVFADNQVVGEVINLPGDCALGNSNRPRDSPRKRKRQMNHLWRAGGRASALMRRRGRSNGPVAQID